MICSNCDNRFDMVVDGDKYWIDGFCSLSCKEEFQERVGVSGKIVDITGNPPSFI